MVCNKHLAQRVNAVVNVAGAGKIVVTTSVRTNLTIGYLPSSSFKVTFPNAYWIFFLQINLTSFKLTSNDF